MSNDACGELKNMRYINAFIASDTQVIISGGYDTLVQWLTYMCRGLGSASLASVEILGVYTILSSIQGCNKQLNATTGDVFFSTRNYTSIDLLTCCESALKCQTLSGCLKKKKRYIWCLFLLSPIHSHWKCPIKFSLIHIRCLIIYTQHRCTSAQYFHSSESFFF